MHFILGHLMASARHTQQWTAIGNIDISALHTMNEYYNILFWVLDFELVLLNITWSQKEIWCHAWLYSRFANHQSKNQFAHNMGSNHCDRSSFLHPLRGLCGYIWVSMLSLSPSNVTNIDMGNIKMLRCNYSPQSQRHHEENFQSMCKIHTGKMLLKCPDYDYCKKNYILHLKHMGPYIVQKSQ